MFAATSRLGYCVRVVSGQPSVSPSKPTSVPLVIDLDGTLIRSDLLMEALLPLVRRNPPLGSRLVVWLFSGKAKFKHKVANAFEINPEWLPYEQEVVNLIQAAHEAGRQVVLATASPAKWAHEVASHLDVFHDVIASDDSVNLAGESKRHALVARYGEAGFDYVGNSHDDIAVLASARHGYLVRPSASVLTRARAQRPATEVLAERKVSKTDWLRSLRLHQWAKNLLVFVPVLAAHQLRLESVLVTMIAFVAFSAIASSIYLFNDILDIHHDRRHARKRHRPVAAGLVTIPEALVAAVVLTLTGFALSLALLPLSFVGVLAAYQVITLGYTLFLKELVLLDVLTLGVLYTLRVVAGAATLLLPLTPWLLAFSMFTFVSLAIVKRYAELSALFNQESEQPLAGRGYFQADLPLLLSLGTSSAYASVLVLALYIQDSGTRTLYENPILMWLAVPAWLYWFHRVWLLTHRKEIHDDPVVFAIKDPMTYVVGSIIAAVFYAAI